MTRIRVSGGNASPADLEALTSLRTNAGNRLTIVRTRAEKWLGGITALTGLLTTAIVIQGPQSATDLPEDWRIAVGILILLALAALVVGVYNAYQSAYGDPTKLDEIPEQPISTLAQRLQRSRQKGADAAMRQLSTAVAATILAVALLATAIALTWFAPAESSSDKDSVCLTFENKPIAELPGDRITITTLTAGVALADRAEATRADQLVDHAAAQAQQPLNIGDAVQHQVEVDGALLSGLLHGRFLLPRSG